MRPLSATELLSVWEQGQGQPATTQALLLLAAAAPDSAVAQLSIGRRDALLLTLREWLFGPRLVSLAICPQCAQKLELDFAVAEIRAAANDIQPETLTAVHDGYEAQFRLPNSADLAAVVQAGAERAGAGSELLLARCLLEIRCEGRAQPVEPVSALPPALLVAIVEEMGQADPQANVRLNLTCADCGHRWAAAFDIVSYIWSEIDDWARRILREVHLLAVAYGWHEADILMMSARRRQLYLQMLGA